MNNVHTFQRHLGEEVWFVPHSDCYQSEYLAARDERLAWLTGFTGSAGLAIITSHKACLAVDSRYTLQAQKQVGLNFEVIDFSIEEIKKWVFKNLPKKTTLLYDPWLISINQKEKYQNLFSSLQINFNACSKNLIDELWQDRPQLCDQKWVRHNIKFTGKETHQKIKCVVDHLNVHQLDYLLITACDNVSWLLNIRGNRVPFTPLVQTFALLNKKGDVTLFSDDSQNYLQEFNWQPLQSLPKALSKIKVKIGFDPSTTAAVLNDHLSHGEAICDPITLIKSVKNDTEIEGMRCAHKRDGKALSHFIAWLKNNYNTMTEYDVGVELARVRSQDDMYQGDSFSTIAGFAENGAIVHYRAEKSTALSLKEGILLLDSGAQYLDGTTDVTRTFYIGDGVPSARFRELYTLVLKGHIQLASAVFPRGTTGQQLDILARQFLWRHGLNYGHGTGHGVGAYLSVHEGPQSISPKSTGVALQPGMILSNEPGYYCNGEFGIRHENLVLVCEHNSFKDFLYFETLTRVPFDEACIDRSLLSSFEVHWLDSYHDRIKKQC